MAAKIPTNILICPKCKKKSMIVFCKNCGVPRVPLEKKVKK